MMKIWGTEQEVQNTFYEKIQILNEHLSQVYFYPDSDYDLVQAIQQFKTDHDLF